ncbi:MAG: glycosyl transferase family 39 [uncultured bacterium]|nr:MAG: glycosyl transferase family 39 [uncultured bacterium]KKU26461.1 MAG: hypothetical protein UX37_C0002G0027 [Microgenomates group bacterium GW2011_GWA2_46_16]
MSTWIILGLATILRLVYLNQSLWLDESIQALALMGKLGPLLIYALSDYQPPLYHFIAYAFNHLLGYSEIVLRLPSFFTGILTVYFVVKIGELLNSKRTGLIAGLLAATNPLLIYYSQEGRTYAMTTFFVTASFYYFIQILKEKNDQPPASRQGGSTIYYLLSTTAFLWTSYLSWFLLLAQGIYALYKKRYDLILVQCLAGFTLLTWLPSLIPSLAIGRSTLQTSPEWGRVVGALSWKSLPLTWVKFVIGRIGFDNKILYGAIVATLGLFHLSILKQVNYKKYPVLILWILPPIILSLVTAIFLPVYSYFRLLFVLPAYLLLLAIGSQKLSKVVILSNIIFLAIFWFSPRFHHEDWRSLVHDLPTGATLAIPSRAQSAPLLYYSVTQSILEPSHEKLVGNPVYYLRYAEDLFDPNHLGQANFATSGYTITSQKVYAGLQLDIYENSH